MLRPQKMLIRDFKSRINTRTCEELPRHFHLTCREPVTDRGNRPRRTGIPTRLDYRQIMSYGITRLRISGCAVFQQKMRPRSAETVENEMPLVAHWTKGSSARGSIKCNFLRFQIIFSDFSPSKARKDRFYLPLHDRWAFRPLRSRMACDQQGADFNACSVFWSHFTGKNGLDQSGDCDSRGDAVKSHSHMISAPRSGLWKE